MKTVLYRHRVQGRKRHYTTKAQVVQDHGGNMLTLIVSPRRAEPFQVGPVPHIDDRGDGFISWEEIKDD